MSWTPDPNEPSAVFELPIMDNALAIIVRDFKGGLDYFYSSDSLPDFVEREMGQIIGLQFPCLAITPRENTITQADDNSYLVEAARMNIYMGVTGENPTDVSRKIMKYVRVMDTILRSARRDFFTGMTNPFKIVLETIHEYGPVGGPENSVYFRGAILGLTVNLREGRG
jgi:hypothetical protein